ncbi:MAG TPA: hypothetical protein VLA88_05565 [Candidatus Saccharimonadales bacterium]|nr:hypothetical protein [Candidatus Saccharimonadales bacterium]
MQKNTRAILIVLMVVFYSSLLVQISIPQTIGLIASEEDLDRGNYGIFGEWWPLVPLANLAIIIALHLVWREKVSTPKTSETKSLNK